MEFDFSTRNSHSDATDSGAETLIRAFQKQGCDIEQVTQFFRVTHGDKACFIHSSDTSYTSVVAVKIWKNKGVARKVLRQAGVSVPRGRVLGPGQMQRARQMVERLGSVVVKPVDGIKGSGVSVNVSARELPDAWAAAQGRTSGRILVEEFIDRGQEARYLILDNKCIAVAFRFPPSVCGDGVSTVAELVEQENSLKLATNAGRGKSLIELDTHRQNLLSAKGLSPQSVLEDGHRLVIDEKANISTGGNSYEATAMVHDSYKAIAERVAKSVPGSHVLGVDIIALDHSVEATEDNYVVLEGNTAPGLDIHMFPDYGTPNDVAAKIVESCLRRMASET